MDGYGQLRCFLTRTAMIQALSKSGPETPVIVAMTGDIPTVRAWARLEEALRLLQGRRAPAVGVVDEGGRLVGYVTPENIGELMMIENATGRGKGPLLPQ